MKIQTTRDYGRFVSDKNNRVITPKDAPRLKKLRVEMKTYGFLPAYPLLVYRSGDKLKILDGQHRFAIAEELKLAVWYVETDRSDIVIANIANTQCPWAFRDYVESQAAQGKKAYQELLAFASERNIPLSRAASLMDGQCGNSGNTALHIKDGTFTVRDPEFAERVAKIAQVIYSLVPWAMSSSSLAAIGRFVRVPSFDDEQFIKKVMAHPQLLKKQPALEMYSEMYDTIYNWAARTRLPLSFMAKEAAAGRSCAQVKTRKVA